MTVQPHAETSPIDHQQPANARTGESAFLRGAAYVLLVGAVGIILGHMVIKTAMREKMYDHQRVLKALTPMIPDDREGIAADRGPVQIPGADNSVDLRGVAKEVPQHLLDLPRVDLGLDAPVSVEGDAHLRLRAL